MIYEHPQSHSFFGSCWDGKIKEDTLSACFFLEESPKFILLLLQSIFVVYFRTFCLNFIVEASAINGKIDLMEFRIPRCV